MFKLQKFILCLLMIFLVVSQKRVIGVDTGVQTDQKDETHYVDPKLVVNREDAAELKKVAMAIDILIPWNIKQCSTCLGLKFFAVKAGNNAGTILKYLTVGATCLGALNYIAPTGPSGRPGNDQLFIATQLQDETWLIQPKNCPGNYIKATSAAAVSVGIGFSSTSRFWIQYHDNHVHMQSAIFSSSYWNGITPLQIGGGASSYIVQFWPSRAWP